MVISSTSAVEDSIQAVSPELIFEPSTSSGFVGAGGAAGAAAAGAGAAGAGAGGARFCLGLGGADQPPGPERAKNAKKVLLVGSPEPLRAGLTRAGSGYLLEIG